MALSNEIYTLLLLIETGAKLFY